MKPGLHIDGFQVQGFGHFAGFSSALGPGLNLLYGPNEAGKSTLLAFLRGVLFGFEKRGQAERYEPESGAFGGELRLVTGAGPLVVRRLAGRRSEGELTVHGPDGDALPESFLRDALTHVPRELFFEVFAFRLDELSSFQNLAEQRGVSEALFAAGMRGARRLPEAVERLRKDVDALYAPRGQKPELNRVMRELEEVQRQLREVGDRPARYFEQREALGARSAEQQALEAELRATAREVDRLSRLDSALGDLTELARHHTEREALPPLEGFPTAGAARLDDILQRRKAYRAQQAQLAERLAFVSGELARLAAPWPVRERADLLRAALAAFSERAELMRGLPARRAALAAKRRQVEQGLGELGLAVDASGLLALDLSATARGELERVAGRLEAADTRCREAESARAGARESRERLEDTAARAETEHAVLPDARPAQVRQRQAAAARFRAARGDLERLGEQRLELRRQLDSVRVQGEPAPAQSPLPAWLVGVGVALALLLAGVAGLQAGWLMAALCGGIALALVGLLAHARQRVEAAQHAHREAHAARQRWRQQEEERLRATLASLATREELILRDLLGASSDLGLAPGASLADLAARETSLLEELHQAERREALQRERDALRTQRDAALRDEQRAEESFQLAGARSQSLRAELGAFLEARRFPASATASTARALWSDTAALRQRLQDVMADEAALVEDEATCHEAAARLQGEAARTGLPPGAVEAVAARIAAALEEVRTQTAEQRQRESSYHDLLADKALLDQHVRDEDGALELLLAKGGCADEESFRRRAGQALRYAELTTRARELSQRIEALTGLDDGAAREATREAGGESGLKEALDFLRERHRVGSERLKAVLTEQGALNNQLQQWENDEQLATLRIQEESLRARASELATRYAADRLALALLGRARRRFEEEQQPRVIQLASELFSELTQGRYRRVFMPAGGERELRVGDGQRDWTAEQLSRGTREQLFLAFRLAAIRDFGEKNGALPLIADDVLVNFDPERARAAVRLFARLAERHQVIAFTCHPWLRAQFEAEGACVRELSSSTARLPGTGTEP
ncbi:AAA family ATPase [Corallococcus sp. M34]|uniref:AAA family ATPase n=1 Tax=Citreicoccus inhibens TaxID=2849499 RepID=UPI001C2439A1|nr:AAA family ATPase [Citreicoccus inhibens]MBU8898477.1 AAA family ATPase [Citreicoccus inhibens]